MASILKSKGIAMVTVLIFMLLVVIISGAALSIMTKQARLAENQIRRIRAFYAAESAINKAYQSLRYTDISAPLPGPWIDAGNGGWKWDWTDFEWRVSGDSPVVVDEIKTVTVFYNPTNASITTTMDSVDLEPKQLSANVDYGL